MVTITVLEGQYGQIGLRNQTNMSALLVNGCQVMLNAQGAGSQLGSAVNNSGVILARTLENHNGVIRLLGDMARFALFVNGNGSSSANISVQETFGNTCGAATVDNQNFGNNKAVLGAGTGLSGADATTTWSIAAPGQRHTARQSVFLWLHHVPAKFYHGVASPAFRQSDGIVYIFPETRSVIAVFPHYPAP